MNKIKMNKIKIVRFFAGMIIAAFLGASGAAIKVIFSDCKYGQCVVSECVEIDTRCEENNYDPKTGQELRNCCSEYATKTTSLKDRLIKEMALWGMISGLGLGIFVGILLAGRKNEED